MATTRKSKPQPKARASHAKAKPKSGAKSGAKSGVHAKKAVARVPKPKARAAKPPARVAPKAAARPAQRPDSKFMGKPSLPARPVARAAVARPVPARPAVKGATAAAPRAQAKSGSRSGGKRPVRSPGNEVVRPIGVLPPESRQRVPERPSSPPLAHRAFPTPPPAPRATSQGAERVTEQDLKEFEQRLLAERRKILKEMGHLENTVLKQNQRDSSGDLSGYSFHMADAGTDAMEREKAFLFASAEGRHLLEINEALRRIYKGTYGICEISGAPIARARLSAIPWARYTIEVQEQLEKDERSKRGTP